MCVQTVGNTIGLILMTTDLLKFARARVDVLQIRVAYAPKGLGQTVQVPAFVLRNATIEENAWVKTD